MLRLGPAQLHPANQTLTIGTRTVPLQRKPFLVLQYLIENRDRMILR
jgi:DNA-binding response OmpR family regulator